MLAFAGGISLFLLAACGKDVPPSADDNPPPIVGEPVAKPKGQPTGRLISTVIGSDGGVIQYEDALRLEIPAGAVSQPTVFGVQPITNTLEEGPVSLAFRLTPEDIHFNKPVTISLLYGPLAEGNPRTRSVAFQRNDGVWCAVSTALNASQRQLTVETTHFSDWVWFDRISLRKDKETASAGETIRLKLLEQVLGALVPSNSIDSVPLAAMDDIGFSKDVTVSGWKIVSGPGTLDPKINTHFLHGDAIYTAPATVNEATDVEIQVEVESKSGYISDHSAPGGRRRLGKMILLTTIRLVPEASVQLKLNGVDQDLPQTGNDALFVNGGIHIRAGGQEAAKSIMLQCNGTEPGTYPGGSARGESLFYLAMAEGQHRHFHNNFHRNCENDYSYNGTTSITSVDDYVEGFFVGTLFPANVQNCEIPEGIAVELRFKIKRTL